MGLIFSKILDLIVTVAWLLHQSPVSGILQSNQIAIYFCTAKLGPKTDFLLCVLIDVI